MQTRLGDFHWIVHAANGVLEFSHQLFHVNDFTQALEEDVLVKEMGKELFLITSFKSISNFARMACISLIRSCRASSTLSACTRKSRALFIRIESKVDRSLIWKGFRELFYFLDNENGMSHRILSNSLTVLQGSTGEMFPELFG